MEDLKGNTGAVWCFLISSHHCFHWLRRFSWHFYYEHYGQFKFIIQGKVHGLLKGIELASCHGDGIAVTI